MKRGSPLGNTHSNLRGTRVEHKVFPPTDSVFYKAVFDKQVGQTMQMKLAGTAVHQCLLISATVAIDGTYAILELEIL